MRPSRPRFLPAGFAAAACLVVLITAPLVFARDWPGAIEVRGNLNLSLDEISAAIDSVTCAGSDSVCVERICRALADAYWSRGYVEAEVRCEAVGGGPDTVRVSISEGILSILESVNFDGVDDGDVPAVASIFSDVVAKPLSRLEIEERLAEMLAFYDGRGYPLARVEPDFSSLGEGKVELILRLISGPRAAIGAIILRGMKHTKASAVLPEMGLSVGQSYDGKKIETARNNLVRLGIFEEVSEPVLGFDPEDTTISVAFDLAEARTSLFDGVLGYSPGVRGTRLAGAARLELENLGGTLRKAKIIWARLADGRLSWSLYYREPRILRRPLALEGSLASDVVDTSYARSKLALGAVYVGRPGLEIGTGVFLGSAKDRSVAGGEGNFREKGLSFHMRREGRERPMNPTSGTFFEVRNEIESLDYADDKSLNRTVSNLDVGGEVIIPAAAGTNLALRSRFRGVVSSSGSVPVSHMIGLGGLSTLRGYPEEWFRCEKALTISLELRRLLGSESRVHVFVDAATLENSALSLWRSEDVAFGYGLGVMAAAGRSVLRVEVAAGRGDHWSDTKLHLGVVQEF